MKGIRTIYLHPDNLIKGRFYRVSYESLADKRKNIIKDGKFKKITTHYSELPNGKVRHKLAVEFGFGSGQISEVIAWERIRNLEQIPTGDNDE